MEGSYQQIIEPITEKFRVNIKNFFGCIKLTEVYMKLTKETLFLYFDQDHKKLYMKIETNTIFAINKRQVDKNDVNTFSVHYKEGKQMKEVKIRTYGRLHTDMWIERLRVIISPKKIELVSNEIGNSKSNNLSTAFTKNNKASLIMSIEPKEFFIRLSLLEFILKFKMRLLFWNRLAGVDYVWSSQRSNRTSKVSYFEDKIITTESEQKSINRIEIYKDTEYIPENKIKTNQMIELVKVDDEDLNISNRIKEYTMNNSIREEEVSLKFNHSESKDNRDLTTNHDIKDDNS